MSDDFRDTLYTVDETGRRNWVYATLAPGKFYKSRKVIAYLLMAFYLLMPWVSIDGKQGVLLNIAERRFVFFGSEFWATDLHYMFLSLGILAFALFFFTALLGRVWCGWACPETVFLEFVFRPLERLIEGSPSRQRRRNQGPWTAEKVRVKAIKFFVFALISWALASTAVAYFVGREELFSMIMGSPLDNLGPFIATVTLMGLLLFQFGWFREQFCTVLCPYARFQSVLMDSQSLVVGYDTVRGEPKNKRVKKSGKEPHGDCIDCGLCVRVCPTGIDIRNGVQLECIACTQCIDACDSIMEKIDRPKGLIRYDTENVLLGKDKKRQIKRIRPIAYGTLLLLFTGVFAITLASRELSEAQVLRSSGGQLFTLLSDARVSNQLQVKVSNKSDQEQTYTVALLEPENGIEIIAPLSPLSVAAGQISTMPLFVNFPASRLDAGNSSVQIKVSGTDGFATVHTLNLLGPDKARD